MQKCPNAKFSTNKSCLIICAEKMYFNFSEWAVKYWIKNFLISRKMFNNCVLPQLWCKIVKESVSAVFGSRTLFDC